jgi:hypothetical protein
MLVIVSLAKFTVGAASAVIANAAVISSISANTVNNLTERLPAFFVFSIR